MVLIQEGMKRIENQSGFQWAAQVLREGSRNEKENFSLAEARPLAEPSFRWRRPRLLAETPFCWRRSRLLAETPFAGGGPGYWKDPLFTGVGHGYWQKTPFRWQSVRATGVGSTAQINAQACNSEKRCDSLQITFLLKDNYAKIKYQNIKDGHKTNEQLFYIRSTYLRTAA